MAKPGEKLAEALEVLSQLQKKGVVAISTDMLTRIIRERLLKAGFIREVYKGWYISASPYEGKGDSTSWYGSFWEFCAQLLNKMYGDNWSISPEQSLLLHAGNTSVPQQLIVRSPAASNNKTDLPFNTSLFHLKSKLPDTIEVIDKSIKGFSLAAALVEATSTMYTQNPVDVRTALSMVADPSEVLAILLEGGHSIVAGRLAGAFRNIKRGRFADQIISTMQKANYEIREFDPFDDIPEVSFSLREKSPYGNRIRILWNKMREVILKNFPAPPGPPADRKSFLESIEKMYVTDAYHSLSIEKYQVTPELIERVRSGAWDAKGNEADKKQRDAMAAKGYWDAFQSVEQSIVKILDGENAGEVVDADHRIWYQELFGPSVSTGLLKPADLAGYRNHQVYIGQSKHVPLNKEAVRDAMPVLFELLTSETEPAVRAVLGHFIFVFIHPYMDGNGRMGRFLMNAMLSSGGYPWTVIPVEERQQYMEALEQASVNQNIEPFAAFVGRLVTAGLAGKPIAKI